MTPTESLAFQELEKLGWSIANKGWPDFLLFRQGTNGLELMAVEVKSVTDGLRPEQVLILEALSHLMPVYVLRECGDGQLRECRINSGRTNG